MKCVIAILFMVYGCSVGAASIVKHPQKLNFDAYSVHIPLAASSAHILNDGSIAFIVEDPGLPLVRVSIISRFGRYIDESYGPALASLTETMMRDGGIKGLTPEEVDEQLDFLATNITIGIDETRARIDIDTLSKNLDASLQLARGMLLNPQFDQKRLEITKSQLFESMKKRNDDTRVIEPRIWRQLMLGEGYYTNQQSSQSDLENLDAEILAQFAAKIFKSGQLVITASGDVETSVILSKLNQLISELPKAGRAAQVPSITQPQSPGLYVVDKADVSQSRVSLGMPSLRHDHQDRLAFELMNQILGGGGFVSRITSRVRSDEGLAYSAGSVYYPGVYHDGEFKAYFQSKNQSVAYALAIVIEEIERIQQHRVSVDELQLAKEALISKLSLIFRNPYSQVNSFAYDEMVHRDPNYWTDYEKRVQAVTIQDIQRVANRYLDIDKMSILVVGNIDEVLAGDGEHQALLKLTKKRMKHIKLKDPLTLSFDN